MCIECAYVYLYVVYRICSYIRGISNIFLRVYTYLLTLPIRSIEKCCRIPLLLYFAMLIVLIRKGWVRVLWRYFFPILIFNYSMIEYSGDLVDSVIGKVVWLCLSLFHLCFQLPYLYNMNGGLLIFFDISNKIGLCHMRVSR